MMGVVLGIYLSRAGFSPTFIGVVIATGLAGAAAGTLAISFHADRLGRRRMLIGLSLLATAGGVGFALVSGHFALPFFAFVGMLNGMGTDRGPAFALEQALVPQLTPAGDRTWALAWYAFALDVGHAVGALGASLPFFFQRWLAVDLLASYRFTFGIYAGLNLVSGLLYLMLSQHAEAEIRSNAGPPAPVRISSESKKIVAKLAALSGLDSLGGGFLSDALIAYWFFRRFGATEDTLGLVFFFGHVSNSFSYPVAAWLARRVGLVKTMVFTHIPANLFLMAVPFAPSLSWAIALLLARESMVEMDVPTRQSYIVGVVQPSERTYASGISNVTRNVSRAISPSLAGFLMQQVALGSALIIGNGIKIVYDLALYFAFRSLKPPEERKANGSAPAIGTG